MTDIRAVIFDMDGVLCDSERFICQAAIRMFRQRYGVEVRPEDFLPFIGTGETQYLVGVGRKYGLELTMPDDRIFTYEIYLDVIRGQLPPLGGAVEFIRMLEARGVKVAVASAADRMKVEGNLREIGFSEDEFDAVITGSDVTRHKPDPQCFLMAAERIGIAPEHCLVVEDAHNGCRAAKAANMTCLGITTSFKADALKQSGADHTAPDLAHVPADLF
jgi:HAD superfamily hydrolase (TIGR01509 family)